ncbi:hypothetical protein CFRA_00085 [Corynebacterium frankenforstense DSM 45800]|uniref:ABC transporter domain-containing protein n=1 Tax=Corynebacterium frankenforstense DSM 45800 TaxID=1437875 RepID=A0A1L7CQ20_9CORY|nr:ABC transporter ATP-binding protein [Corynebacterium frankenforstense]APT87966.1 hypothetical protein CFRA_00085 [Corynebacterium frankenforstense DSM 45800]
METRRQPPATPAIRVRGLRKDFPGTGVGGHRGTVHALRGVDLEIDRGEIVALLGPNGSGKSTLIDQILGLAGPTAGHVEVFGGTPKEAVSAGRVGAALQTGGLLDDLTVNQTVRMLATTYAEHRDVGKLLEYADLTELAGRRVRKLSGGERQRLRFALTILADPDLMILDEPTTGMDATARRDFWRRMEVLARAGHTILFATHYLEEAEHFAERTVLLAKGRVIADAPTSELRDLTARRTVCVDVPRAAAARIEGAEILAEPRGARRADGAGADAAGADTAGTTAAAVDTVDTADTADNTDTVRVCVHADAAGADRLALRVLGELGGRNLTVEQNSLEDTFVALTGADDTDDEENPR